MPSQSPIYFAKMNNMTDQDFVIGFDLGGTKLQATALDCSFSILATNRKKTRAVAGGEEVYQRIKDCIAELAGLPELKRRQLKGIGLGGPGILDSDTGVIVYTPNLHWENFPLGPRLNEDFSVPVCLENDVNMGLYGEFHFGAGKGFKHVIGLFPGTGIGGGLILNGELYRGTGNAGELGHMTIQVDGPFGAESMRGTLEALASRLAIAKEAAVLAAQGEAPWLLQNAGTDICNIRSGSIAKSIQNGDKSIERIVRRAARYLGIAMGSLVNIFSPEAIILGGGLVEKLEDIYMEESVKAMKENSFTFMSKDVKVLAAALGDDAVVMGAGKLVSQKLDR
ncbi:MAG: ROK family protein [Planctomycetota bacterium]|nr:ROK family protein [Planctomycetota bacterium]MDA1142445.1 ROK family protein [Planctomycetota bacterium]